MDPTGIDLNLISMTPEERWELYQRAESLGLFYQLPKRPQPIAPPLAHTYQIGYQKQLWPSIQSNNTDLSEEDRRAAAYAWHVWRERTDVWDHNFPKGHMTYDQFISVYELERYFVNPWLRASAWVHSSAVNLLDLVEVPKFDMLTKSIGSSVPRGKDKRSRFHNHFQFFVAEIPRWWVTQRQMGNFGPVPEMSMASAGYVSVADRDPAYGGPQPDLLLAGNWHSGVNNSKVEFQKQQAFSWDEFIWRRDEIAQMIPFVISSMNSVGPRGASLGDGSRKMIGKSINHLWTNERKLLNRLTKRVATAQGFVDALAEVALIYGR